MMKFLSISLISIALFFPFVILKAQDLPADSSSYVKVNPELVQIFDQKVPKKYKIAEISVKGNRYFDENLLISISGMSVGEEVTIPGTDLFSKVINKLWSQNYFSDVAVYLTQLKGKNLSVEIQVTERPRLSKYTVHGISKSESDELASKMGLVTNRIVTENMKRTAAEAIKKYFKDKSFGNVSVKISEKIDTARSNSLLLDFQVDKGNKVKVNDISFAGVSVDPLKLKKQMKGTKEKMRLTLTRPDDTQFFSTDSSYKFSDYLLENGYLSYSKTKKLLDPYVRLNLFSSAKFNTKKYEEDKEKLIEYYNSLGYRDAVIVKDTIAINKQGNINLGLKINEGKKYYFGDITWKGNTKYSDSILSMILGIKKGDTYNLELLNKGLGKQSSAEGGNDISGLYMDDGYLFFRADPVETSINKDTINFEIRLMEGPQATIKNINISGNDKTKDHVIRREIRTIPGEKFRRSDLIRTQREIAQLNYFNQEKIGINPRPNPEDGTVDIDYSVEEKSSDQLELSAGWGANIGVTGTIGIAFNNFSLKNIFKKSAWDPLPMGDGQRLSLRVQSNGKAYRSYNISFTEPWLGGKKRNAFMVSYNDSKFANAYDPLTGSYTSAAANNSFIKTQGGSVGITMPLNWPDDYFSLSMGINYTRYRLKNYYIDRVNLPGFNNGFSNNLNLRFSLQRLSINQPIYPRTGSNFMLSLQLTPPYSIFNPNVVNAENPYTWVEYYKWRFNSEWYFPIGKPAGPEKNKQFVVKAAAKFGFLGRYNQALQISPFERFQLGDAGMTNQYALLGYDIIAQRGYPVYQTSDPKYNPDQSGASEYFTMFNKYVLELRYPLSLNPSSTIYALAFFEAANGWYNFKDYNPFNLRRSVGIGMRFYLPMFGLLGFDYGIGLDRINQNTSFKSAAKFTFMLGVEPE